MEDGFLCISSAAGVTLGGLLAGIPGEVHPKSVQDGETKEFIELKQNNMTVAEYGLRFTQLSVYAANLVTTEEEKCQKFEETMISVADLPRMISRVSRVTSSSPKTRFFMYM